MHSIYADDPARERMHLATMGLKLDVYAPGAGQGFGYEVVTSPLGMYR